MVKVRIGVAAMGLLLLAAAPALAGQVDGPRFISSDPQAGEKLNEAPQRVEITFAEPLDPSSEIRIFDECETRIDDGSTTVSANTMEVGYKTTPRGTHTVFYSASGPGGITGETNDSFQFTVETGKSCGGGAHGSGHGSGGEKHGSGGEKHGSGGEKHGSGGEKHGSGSGHGEGDSHDGSGHGDGDHKTYSGDGSGEGHDGSGGGHTENGHTSSGAHSGDQAAGDHGGSGSHTSASGTSHTSGSHSSSGGRHGSSGKHGEGHGSNAHSSTSHGSASEGSDPSGSTDFAARGGSSPFEGVEGSAVLMALAAALVLGAGGGWVIRTNNLA